MNLKARTDWYGAYLGGKKVGYAQLRVRHAEGAEVARGVGVVVALEMTMKVYGNGNADTLKIIDVRSYSAQAPHGLIDARYEQSSSSATDSRSYSVRDGVAQVTRKLSGAAKKPVTVQVSQERLRDQVAQWGHFVESGVAGAEWKGANFAWDELKDMSYRAKLKGHSKVSISGLSLKVGTFEIIHDTMNLSGKVRVLADGTMLEMSLGPQLVLRLEEKSVAVGAVGGLNVAAAGIVPNRPLVRPDELDELSLELTSTTQLVLPSRGSRAASRCKGQVCRLRIRRGLGARVTSQDRASALLATQAIDFEDDAVRKQARVVAGAAEGEERLVRLVQYVYASLRKRLATNLPSASIVLREGYGDCTEHTWLFVALARALGIPARPVYGLAYVSGNGGRFAYHAWAEVEYKGQWLEVDPTWGQAKADVSHLPLGDDVSSIATSYGGLEIKILQAVR